MANHELYAHAFRIAGISSTYDRDAVIAAVTKAADAGALTPDEVQTCAVRKVSTGLYAECKRRVALTREEQRLALTAPGMTVDALIGTKALRLAMQVDAVARTLARDPGASR